MQVPLPFWYCFGIVMRQRGIAWRCIWAWTGAARGAARRWPTPPGGCSGRARPPRPTSGPIPRARARTSSPRRRAALDAAERRAGLGDLVAVLGLAGANVAGRGGAAGAGAAVRARARSRSDAVVALKGALGDDDGITAAIGTGSVFGVQRGGGGADDRRLGVPARRPRQRRGDGAGALRARRCSRTTARSSGRRCWRRLLAEHGGPAGIVAWGRAARAGGLRAAGAADPRGARRPATRRRRRSSARPRPRSRGRSTG